MINIDTETLQTIDKLSPTDAKILEQLDKKGRDAPGNIADNIDRTPEHVSTRIQTLREKNLVESVGRDTISLYTITQRGTSVKHSYTTVRTAINR